MKATVDQIIKDLFYDLSKAKLSDGQFEYIRSLEKYYRKYKKLSESQFKTLLSIKKFN